MRFWVPCELAVSSNVRPLRYRANQSTIFHAFVVLRSGMTSSPEKFGNRYSASVAPQSCPADVENGAQLSEVQRVLGHTRLSPTGIYLPSSEDDLPDAIDKAGL
jgi:hypothetical protein